MNKEDLIAPTFVLALLTFVWVTGTPTVEDTTVYDWREYSDLSATEELTANGFGKQICDGNASIETLYGAKLKLGEGTCLVQYPQSKTQVEIYGLKAVV